jgi:hypothetical protein
MTVQQQNNMQYGNLSALFINLKVHYCMILNSLIVK